jgi:hypothetical protein
MLLWRARLNLQMLSSIAVELGKHPKSSTLSRESVAGQGMLSVLRNALRPGTAWLERPMTGGGLVSGHAACQRVLWGGDLHVLERA